MAHRHAHERDLQRAADGVVEALTEHPDWKTDPIALRDRLDGLIDKQLGEAELHDEWQKIQETFAP